MSAIYLMGLVLAGLLALLLIFAIPVLGALQLARWFPVIIGKGLFLIAAAPVPMLWWVSYPWIWDSLGILEGDGPGMILVIAFVALTPLVMILSGIAAGCVALRLDRGRRPDEY